MTTTKETINLVQGEGICYMETLDLVAGEGTLTTEELVFTDDASLVDTCSEQITARHQRSKIILIRDKA